MPGPIAPRPVEQEIADVLERDHVGGDDVGIDLGRLLLAARKEPVEGERADLARRRRLEDQPHAERVGDPADQDAEHRKQPPLVQRVVEYGDRDPQQEAEDEAEVDHQLELPLPEVAEDPDHQRRVGPELLDH